jgi:hypothetical protein
MRMSRTQRTVGAIVVVLAAALIVGLQLRDGSVSVRNPSASPTPTAIVTTSVSPTAAPTPAIVSPSATATSTAAGAIYNDDFGFIVTNADGGGMRNESSNARIVKLSIGPQALAVSPDGTHVAYWKPGSGPAGEGAQLRMFTTLGSATEDTLVTLAADRRGGGVAWSSDGAGLLYSTETGSFRFPGTNSATLDVYELAAGGRRGVTIDNQINTGLLYRPLAWDRSANLAAAGLAGTSGGMGFYVTVRINPDNSFNAQRVDTMSIGMLIGSVRVSSDAKLVLGVEQDTGTIRWWPLADFAAGKSQAGVATRGALWRPGTHEIGFLSAEQFWLGDVDKAGSFGLCCTAFSGAPATSTVRAFRADGSAVVLAVISTGGLIGETNYTLVRLGNDPKSTSGDRVAFQDLGGLSASVRFR